MYGTEMGINVIKTSRKLCQYFSEEILYNIYVTLRKNVDNIVSSKVKRNSRFKSFAFNDNLLFKILLTLRGS